MEFLDSDELLFSMSIYSKINEVKRLIAEPALLEQMGEECAELAQALLKKARKIRGENYTPKTFATIDNDIVEEFTDVILCSMVLSLEVDTNILNKKLDRWICRNKSSSIHGDSLLEEINEHH